ncbi:hypothetical protein ABZP36_024434 [Zizania latifolia]
MACIVKLIIVYALLAGVHHATTGGSIGADGTIMAVLPLAAWLHACFSVVAMAGGGGSGSAGGGWIMECWSTVTELWSCTNEIMLFFLNSESYLGLECCVAICTITRHCCHAMLAFVGFTTQEADILRGFCDILLGFCDSEVGATAL